MIRVIIIDDELPGIDELKYYLEKRQNFEIVGTFTDPKQGLMAIIQETPEVVFLDIHMPELKGDAIAEMISALDNPPCIIFVTAYDEYAVKAFEVNATDYILKPIQEERFNKILNKIEKSKNKESLQKLPLWKGDKIVIVDIDDILFITNDNKELLIHTTQGVFHKKDNLTSFEEELGYNFFRCHRNFVINLNRIDEIIPWFNNTYVVKYNKYELDIPVSRRNTKIFKERLKL